MTTSNLIMVVAPATVFRRSLEFALESAGFEVDSHSSLSAASASPSAAHVLCAVIDESTLSNPSAVRQAAACLGKPVILLARQFRSVPDSTNVIVLVEPLAGDALIDAVRSIIAGAAAPG